MGYISLGTEKIFAVYKPKGPTSYDVVDRIKRLTGEKRVGHAGTLDPLASGVLVIGVGREATKKLADIVDQEKEYIVKIKLGETSTTDDAEGTKTPYESTKRYEITKEEIEDVLREFAVNQNVIIISQALPGTLVGITALFQIIRFH